MVQARTEREDLRPQRVWTLPKGDAVAIDLKAVPGIGAGDRAHRGRGAAEDEAVPVT